MSTVVAERSGCVTVVHQPRGATQARHHLIDELRGEVSPELLADAVSVVAELVGNAVLHARPLQGNVVRVAWRLRHEPAGLRLQVWVTDGGAAERRPGRRQIGPEAIRGRGLTIVEAIADRWGAHRDRLGQSVWAELRRPRHLGMHHAAVA